MKLVFWLLVAFVAFYTVYSAFMAVSSYFAVSDIVERAADATSRASDNRGGRMKAAIVKSAGEGGITLDERLVNVTEAENGVQVQVRWVYPVLVWNQEPVIAVPLSLERSYATPAR